MENDFNMELSEIRRQKILNNNKIKTRQNKFEMEENKVNKKSRKFLFDKDDFHKMPP